MNKLFALLVSFVLLAGMWIPTYATFEDVDTNEGVNGCKPSLYTVADFDNDQDYELIISRQSVLFSLLSLVNMTLILRDGLALKGALGSLSERRLSQINSIR